MFCVHHPIPHEDCPHCLTTIAAMRPTVFAELAAAELGSGIECCPSCDHVYDEAVAKCPQCGAPHPSRAPDFPAQPVADLGDLTFRDLAGASGRSGSPAAGSRAMR